MRTAAHWVSAVFHPVFAPLATLWLALRLDPHIGFFIQQDSRWILLIMIAVMTVIFPLTSTLLLLRAKMISSLTMPSRAERVMPFAMTIFYYAMTYYLLRQSPLHPLALSIFLGIAISALLVLLITIRWKISAHMAGIGAFTGALGTLSTIHDLRLFHVIAGSIMLAGVVGTARSLISDHSPGQIYAGFLLGWGVTSTCVLGELHL